MARPPSRRASSTDIARFLGTSRAISNLAQRKARLIFAIDATASRQPTWNTATHLQQDMFRSGSGAANLSLQLCYYRGFHDFFASEWLADGDSLASLMGRVHCEGGHTQIARLLRHALKEHQASPLRALVFIGDALEENADTLCQLAGECGLRKLPLFLFQEGHAREVETCFRDMAKLSGGAWARFDSASAALLAELLGAVARYASGGRAALENQTTKGAKLLLQQLKP
ncbi:VWA domain-containing protein [Parahaliea aestuarii]|uniref:VWA domain-containing protein n=1 Tax=Parahaliea aestuarii TaxID=1852021 RepID=A0A5C9A4V8_9GAMM|nr:VWA domain-containing protein [Parahaliea aestuarii]TXS95012.1 VWA domain-containing protein [Parahaliea aestuarii]